MTKYKEALLCCPFCGGDAYLIRSHDSSFINCEKDDCADSAFDTDEDAIKAWNTRAPLQTEWLEIEGLKKSIPTEEEIKEGYCPEDIEERAAWNACLEHIKNQGYKIVKPLPPTQED